jgi:hypothetical protein
MRWHEISSEQLDIIVDTLIAYHKRLTDSIDSAQKAGLSRLYDLETQRLIIVDKSIDIIRDVRRTES